MPAKSNKPTKSKSKKSAIPKARTQAKPKKSIIKPQHIVYAAVFLIANYLALHVGHALSLFMMFDEVTPEAALAWFQFNLTSNAFAPLTTLFTGVFTLLIPFFANIMIISAMMTAKDKRKSFRLKKEHGSAYFSKVTDFAHLRHPEKGQNIILSQNILLSIDHHATGTNLNAFIIGGPGSGKTRGFMKPNIINLANKANGAGANMVVTDPKGNLLKSVGKFLKKQGYTIKVLNLSNIAKSDFYNPFAYMRIEREEDRAQVISLIEVIIKSTNATADGKSGGSSDSFWENSEKMLLQALFFYILETEPKERQSLVTVLELLDETSFSEDGGGLAKRFKLLAEQNPASLAVSFWKQISASNTETMRSTLAISNARFSLFKAIAHMFSKDTLELDKLDSRKTVIFVTTSPANSSLNFIATMFYTQLFQQIDYIATEFNAVGAGAIEPSLKIPLLLLLDEFANIPKIPNFLEMLAYARSLNVGIMPIFQSLVQAQKMYEKDWETIVDACDTFLFLGGAKSNFTTEYVSKLLGKETIDMQLYSTSHNKGKNVSQNVSALARELMTADEISRIKKGESILRIGSISPIVTPKYDLRQHPHYKYLADASPDDPNALYEHHVPERYVRDVYVVEFEIEVEVEDVSHQQTETFGTPNTTNTSTQGYDSHNW